MLMGLKKYVVLEDGIGKRRAKILDVVIRAMDGLGRDRGSSKQRTGQRHGDGSHHASARLQ